ncbi:alpha/beta fold hydrolase [Mesorhizobium huakuii]|uniref:Alpha/beta hydrolase n=1 Tax=Mesorhizobium huakuii TaxID=28104 RepID=A0ABZ0VM19_9HYPH|nr:alpha/beta hydrolase [Mesorhizobium huakuii]WQB98507.1 alpha/beta hydrolase [Mesorhizobium huakuii]
MTEADFIRIDGDNKLFIRDWGFGPPVLFMAGWALPSDLWGQVMVLLAERGYRTLAYDRRGHGQSTDRGGVGYDVLADDLAHVLESRDLRDCTIVAHSGAAGEVIRYATRHGIARLKQVFFVGAQGPCVLERPDNPDGISVAAFEDVMGRLKDDLPRWLDENIDGFIPGRSRVEFHWVADMVLRCSRPAIVDFQRVVAEADLRDEARRFNAPLTIIHGDADVSCPIAQTGKKYAAMVPGADLIIYEGAAHGLMITHASRLAEDIAAGLERRDP